MKWVQATYMCNSNINRSADDMQFYQQECVPVTHDTIQGAVDWLWNLDRLAPVSKTATCEAIIRAMTDQNVSCSQIVLTQYENLFCMMETLLLFDCLL